MDCSLQLMRRLTAAIAVIVSAGAAPGPSSASNGARGICVGVTDGDSIVVELEVATATVHLWGIDAPELDQPWGPEARDALGEVALGREVELGSAPDPRASATTTVTVEGENLSRLMIDRGFAWLPLTGETSDAYAAALFVARAHQRGMWSDDRSKLEHPEEWLARRNATPIPTPTPIPRALSDIADSVAINIDGEGVAISDHDLRSTDISLPDSEYAQCVLPVLSNLKQAVADLRASTKGMTDLPKSGVRYETMHGARRVIRDTKTTRSCPTDEQTWRGDSLVDDAIRSYRLAVQCMFEDLRQAKRLLREGDDYLIEARATFKRAYAEKQRKAAEANEGKKRW